MTVGDVRDFLESSTEPVYIISGPDKRFRTYMMHWTQNRWEELPNALKIIFAEFHDRENFIDCLYELILDSDDDEPIEQFITRIKIMENNCNLGNLFDPTQELHFEIGVIDDFWYRTPLRIVPKEDLIFFKEDDRKSRLVSASNLKKWLEWHPCQRVYMTDGNLYILNEDLTDVQKRILSKCETIALYDEEKH